MTKRLRGRAAVAQRLRRLTDEPLCRMCKAKGTIRIADVIDHIVPLAKGGGDDDANTRPLCNDCHRDATAAQFGYRIPQRIGIDGWPVQE